MITNTVDSVFILQMVKMPSRCISIGLWPDTESELLHSSSMSSKLIMMDYPNHSCHLTLLFIPSQNLSSPAAYSLLHIVPPDLSHHMSWHQIDYEIGWSFSGLGWYLPNWIFAIDNSVKLACVMTLMGWGHLSPDLPDHPACVWYVTVSLESFLQWIHWCHCHFKQPRYSTC